MSLQGWGAEEFRDPRLQNPFIFSFNTGERNSHT